MPDKYNITNIVNLIIPEKWDMKLKNRIENKIKFDIIEKK